MRKDEFSLFLKKFPVEFSHWLPDKDVTLGLVPLWLLSQRQALNVPASFASGVVRPVTLVCISQNHLKQWFCWQMLV